MENDKKNIGDKLSLRERAVQLKNENHDVWHSVGILLTEYAGITVTDAWFAIMYPNWPKVD